MRRTSKRFSISLHPSKNGGRSKVIENSGIGMSDHWIDSSTSVPMSEIVGQNSRPTIWKSLGRNIDVKNFHDGNAHSCTAKKDYFFLYMWTISKWKERKGVCSLFFTDIMIDLLRRSSNSCFVSVTFCSESSDFRFSTPHRFHVWLESSDLVCYLQTSRSTDICDIILCHRSMEATEIRTILTKSIHV